MKITPKNAPVVRTPEVTRERITNPMEKVVRSRDDFFRPIAPPPDWIKKIDLSKLERVTLSKADRKTADGLSEALSGPKEALRRYFADAPEATLRRGKDGIVRGPEGQPLVEVKLKNGQTAYVDPNTNQYWVSEPNKRMFSPDGKVMGCFPVPSSVNGIDTTGPYPLPEGAEFSNSHFSDADVRALTREAKPFDWRVLERPVYLGTTVGEEPSK
jgi:hypothetical protein